MEILVRRKTEIMIRINLNGLLTLVLTCMLCLSSCNTDEAFTLELWVQNDLSENITLSIKNYVDERKALLVDTVFNVSANNKTVIYITGPIGDPRDLYSEGFTLFESITITKENAVASPKDFALREEWNFERVGEDNAVYTLIIDESDF